MTIPARLFALLALPAIAIAQDPIKNLGLTATGAAYLTGGDSAFALATATYGRVEITNWLRVLGRDDTTSQTVFLSGQDKNFEPLETTIKSSFEPVVKKLQDGSWAITFKYPSLPSK